ncbi:MAG TPA: hypothetical protein VFU63_08075, partial [Ktedonobacterales bacterium]|nr:hypothetical protein [Ktedonobacterales bacterium]
RLAAVFAELDGEASAWLDAEDISPQHRRIIRSADVRYLGQSYELTVELAPGSPAEALASTPERFAERYKEVYGYVHQGERLEIVNLRVQAVGTTPKPELRGSAAAASGVPQPVRQREVRRGGQHHQMPIYHRADLAAGHRLAGPAIITQYDTTTFVPVGFKIRVDDRLNLIGERA